MRACLSSEFAVRRSLSATLLTLAIISIAVPLDAQENGPTAEQVIEEAMERAGVDDAAIAVPAPTERLNLLTLVMKGGLLMIPIAAMSVMVVMMVVERALALRRERVMPRGLIEGLGRLGAVPGVMDPRKRTACASNIHRPRPT